MARPQGAQYPAFTRGPDPLRASLTQQPNVKSPGGLIGAIGKKKGLKRRKPPQPGAC